MDFAYSSNNIFRSFLARELSSDGKIGGPSTHVYYEVCTAPKLYELVAALLRTKHAATETVRS
jgi:hypothetical protein